MKNIIFSALLLFIFSACVKVPEDEGTSSEGLHISRSQQGLALWQINLDTSNISSIRTLGGSSYADNPPFWIILSDENCSGVGIPAGLKKPCRLGGQTLGITYTRFYNTGQIVDSTIIILDSYMEGSATEANKVSVYAHEIGHALGLEHYENINNLMYPYTSGADEPNANELAIINSSYNPIAAPVASDWKDYFTQVGERESDDGVLEPGTSAIRWHSFPVPYIGVSGYAFRGKTAQWPKGPAISQDYYTVITYLKKDGCYKERVIHSIK